jgi:hypothetical protein
LTLSLESARSNASFGSDAKSAFFAGASESKNFAPVQSKFEDDTKTASIKSTMDLPVTSTVMQESLASGTSNVVVDTPKVRLVVPEDMGIENTSPNAKCSRTKSIKLSNELIPISTVKSATVYPLQAILPGTYKAIQVKINISNTLLTTANQPHGARSRCTPTVTRRKDSPKTPSCQIKKFVTPNVFSADNNKYGCLTISPISSIAVSANRKQMKTSKKDSYDEYSRRAAEFERSAGVTFPEIVHEMVTNASCNIASVLHWNDSGDGFVVEKVVSSFMRKYTSSPICATHCHIG